MKDKIIIGVITAVATTAILGTTERMTGWISEAITRPSIPSGSILMTNQECSAVFGRGWSPYDAAQGRFPIAAGTTVDPNDERRSFGTLEDTGGSFRHLLIEEEMPTHDHTPTDHVFTNLVGNTGFDAATGTGQLPGMFSLRQSEPMEPRGDSLPHNNMPPYIVLNFCIRD